MTSLAELIKAALWESVTTPLLGRLRADISEQLSKESTGYLRASLKAQQQSGGEQSIGFKAAHARARHDLQAYLSSLKLAARAIKGGQIEPEAVHKMIRSKFEAAAHYLSKDRIEVWQAPVVSEAYLQDLDRLQAWRQDLQETFSMDRFWHPADASRGEPGQRTDA